MEQPHQEHEAELPEEEETCRKSPHLQTPDRLLWKERESVRIHDMEGGESGQHDRAGEVVASEGGKRLVVVRDVHSKHVRNYSFILNYFKKILRLKEGCLAFSFLYFMQINLILKSNNI